MDSAGAKSHMSEDMKELNAGKEDISHKVQGHKANLSNPSMSQSRQEQPRQRANLPSDTSEKSKQNSKNVIEALGGDAAHYGDETNPRSKNAAEELDGSRAM